LNELLKFNGLVGVMVYFEFLWLINTPTL